MRNLLLLLIIFFTFLSFQASSQCRLLNENFSTDPVLSATNLDGAWYPDRYPPSAFVSDAGRLKISIDGINDGALNRPSGQQGSFYNTQGRKFNQCGSCVTVAKGDLYIPLDWATDHRRSDMWATAYDATNAISAYPIIGFRNVDGASPGIFFWDDNLGWVNSGVVITYDNWYSFEFKLAGGNIEYRVNNVLVGTAPALGSTYFGDIIMQAYNFNDPALAPTQQSSDSYDAFWDNLITTGTDGKIVTNLNSGLKYCTIQSALNAATANDVIEVGAGIYNERVIIGKSLTLQGVDSTTCIMDGTGLVGTGSGIYINNGITDVNIKKLKIQDFTGSGDNSTAALFAASSNNRLFVEELTIVNNPSNHGIFCVNPSVVDDITITKSTVRNHGPGLRGIVIWDNLKTNITITDNTITNNSCCGIELQDGDASAVNISGNIINIGNGDNALGLTGMNPSMGANTINNNIITGGGRFGIEIKNPAGGVTVSGNQVTMTTQNGDLRDRAGIAILRRGVLYNNVDVPNDVTITGNTIDGYQQAGAEEGFGIVVEGINHIVTGNTVQNCEVGILQQQNPTDYPSDANTGSGGSPVLSPNLFGRGNSPITCGNTISGNSFSGNGTDTRDIGVGYGVVTNTNTSEYFCSIQAAINDAQTLDGHIIEAEPATYPENVTVSKQLTIKGAKAGVDARGRVVGSPDPTVESVIAPAAGIALNLGNGTNASTIDGFSLLGSPGSTEGVICNNNNFATDGLILKNNFIAVSSGSGACVWLNKNAIDADMIQNEFVAATGSTYAIFLDASDQYHGLHFVNNNVLRSGAIGGTGFYVDNNRATGTSASLRTPLFQGNLFQGHALGFNAGIRSFVDAQVIENTFNGNTGGFAGGPKNSDIARNTFSNNTLYGLRLTNFGSTSGEPGAQKGAISTTVENNFFYGNGTTVDMTSGYGDVRLDNMYTGYLSTNTITNNSFASTIAIFNKESDGTTDPVHATCNWFDTTVPAAILAKIINVSGAVTLKDPYLSSGLDAAPVTPGFQPSAPCNGCSTGVVAYVVQTDTYYCSFEEAVAACGPNQTVELQLGTATMTGPLTVDAGQTYIIRSGTTLNTNGQTITNNGTIELEPGATFTNTGIYQGDGQFIGDFINEGTVKPGN